MMTAAGRGPWATCSLWLHCMQVNKQVSAAKQQVWEWDCTAGHMHTTAEQPGHSLYQHCAVRGRTKELVCALQAHFQAARACVRSRSDTGGRAQMRTGPACQLLR